MAARGTANAFPTEDTFLVAGAFTHAPAPPADFGTEMYLGQDERVRGINFTHLLRVPTDWAQDAELLQTDKLTGSLQYTATDLLTDSNPMGSGRGFYLGPWAVV